MSEKWIDKVFRLHHIKWKKKPNDYPERELPTEVIVVTKYNDDPEVDDATKEDGTSDYLSDLISIHFGCSNNGFCMNDVTSVYLEGKYDAPVIMDR